MARCARPVDGCLQSHCMCSPSILQVRWNTRYNPPTPRTCTLKDRQRERRGPPECAWHAPFTLRPFHCAPCNRLATARCRLPRVQALADLGYLRTVACWCTAVQRYCRPCTLLVSPADVPGLVVLRARAYLTRVCAGFFFRWRDRGPFLPQHIAAWKQLAAQRLFVGRLAATVSARDEANAMMHMCQRPGTQSSCRALARETRH